MFKRSQIGGKRSLEMVYGSASFQSVVSTSSSSSPWDLVINATPKPHPRAPEPELNVGCFSKPFWVYACSFKKSCPQRHFWVWAGGSDQLVLGPQTSCITQWTCSIFPRLLAWKDICDNKVLPHLSFCLGEEPQVTSPRQLLGTEGGSDELRYKSIFYSLSCESAQRALLWKFKRPVALKD